MLLWYEAKYLWNVSNCAQLQNCVGSSHKDGPADAGRQQPSSRNKIPYPSARGPICSPRRGRKLYHAYSNEHQSCKCTLIACMYSMLIP
eukprot:350077-Chlamydomonas_euryale.AAC.14